MLNHHFSTAQHILFSFVGCVVFLLVAAFSVTVAEGCLPLLGEDRIFGADIPPMVTLVQVFYFQLALLLPALSSFGLASLETFDDHVAFRFLMIVCGGLVFGFVWTIFSVPEAIHDNYVDGYFKNFLMLLGIAQFLVSLAVVFIALVSIFAQPGAGGDEVDHEASNES